MKSKRDVSACAHDVEQAPLLAAVREASQYAFPTADISEMLAQIESGYLGGPVAPAESERSGE